MDEVFIRYENTSGREKVQSFRIDSTEILLDLNDMVTVDLLPLIWCSNLRFLSLRNNQLEYVDFTSLSNCTKLQSLRLDNNKLRKIDFTPLSSCPKLRELSMRGNPLSSINLSPLFMCPELVELEIDDATVLTADLLLRSVGNWPDVLVKRFYRILWREDTDI